MRQHQVRYLDGGILGFPSNVRDGAVKIAYSGSSEVFEAEKTLLESFGDDCIFIGDQVGMAPLAAMLVYPAITELPLPASIRQPSRLRQEYQLASSLN